MRATVSGGTKVNPDKEKTGYVVRVQGVRSPLHFDVYVSGYFNDLAAVAFLPPPRSPAKNMREPRSPPLLSD